MIILKTLWLMLVVVMMIALITNPVGIAIIVFLVCYWIVKKQQEMENEEKQNDHK